MMEQQPDRSRKDKLRWIVYAQAVATAISILIGLADVQEWWSVFGVLKHAVVPLAISIPLFPVLALVAWLGDARRLRRMLLVVVASVVLSVVQLLALIPLYA